MRRTREPSYLSFRRPTERFLVQIDRKDGGPDGGLEELRDQPVTLFIKGADGDSSYNSRSTSFQVTRKNTTVSYTQLH